MTTQDNELTRPSHYGGEANPFEPIKIIEHYDLDFSLGNVIKYTLRAGNKSSETPEADLQKAAWYAARAAEAAQPQTDTDGVRRLADLYDEESYVAGMRDASGSPSLVLRAIIFALQESGVEEMFVSEEDLNRTPNRAVEIERVRTNRGVDGFLVKVIDFAPQETDIVQQATEAYPEIFSGDPGDEHFD